MKAGSSPEGTDEPDWSHLLVSDGALSDEDYRHHYPGTWHGGPSRPEIILSPMGISAQLFVDASRSDRESAVDWVVSTQSRRMIGRCTLYLVVVLGFLVVLSQPWKLFAVAAVVLKAGTDLGRFVGRMRLLRSSIDLGADDLEIDKPPE